MSDHEPYYVATAGITICVACSDREGCGVPWADAEGSRHSRLLLHRPPE